MTFTLETFAAGCDRGNGMRPLRCFVGRPGQTSVWLVVAVSPLGNEYVETEADAAHESSLEPAGMPLTVLVLPATDCQN